MLIIRFQRQGKKKDFVFRIIAVDSQVAINSGKAKEILGWYNPKTKKYELKQERIQYWLKQGAQVSDSCFNFLIQAKMIEGKKRPIKITKKKVKKGQSVEGAEQLQKEISTEDKLVEETKTESVEEIKEQLVEEKQSVSEPKQESQPEIKPETEPEAKPLEENKEEEIEEKIDSEKLENKK